MSSIDRALLKAFERRRPTNDPSTKSQGLSGESQASGDGSRPQKRELYIQSFPSQPVPAGGSEASVVSQRSVAGDEIGGVPHARLVRIDSASALNGPQETARHNAAPANPAEMREAMFPEQEIRSSSDGPVSPCLDSNAWVVSSAEVVGWQLPELTASEPDQAGDEPESVTDAELADSEGSPETLSDQVLDAAEEPKSEAPVEFKPAWEVDWFVLPDVFHRAIEVLGDQLHTAIGHVIEGCMADRSLVTIRSVQRGEGRTMIALLLAHAASRTGRRVLLVDGDLQHPTLASDLGIAVPTAWTEQNAEWQDLAECCVHSVRDGFTVMALPEAIGSLSANACEQLASALHELARHFDVVICDLGPHCDSSLALHPQAVASHIVVRHAARTSNEDFEQFVEGELEVCGSSMCVIENFADLADVA